MNLLDRTIAREVVGKRISRNAWLLRVLIFALSTNQFAIAADAPSKEYLVKAAFIYNFAQFTEWPAEAFSAPDSPFVIVIVGTDQFSGAIDQAVSDKTVQGHRIEVRRAERNSTISTCHLLFVASDVDGNSLTEIFRSIENKPVLTVGESGPFLANGGIVRFYVDDNRIRFEINPDVAAAVHLKISSKLLKLAKIFAR